MRRVNFPGQRQRRFLERKAQVLEENYHLLSEVYGENERLYHDMNHHLQMIYYLAQKQGDTEVMDYVTSISAPINQLSDVIWCGVDIVDAILNHGVADAEKKGIRMDVNAEFPQNSNISSDDLCVILFNLLDNAMESCERLLRSTEKNQETPVIAVTIRKIRHFLMIKVQNPSIHPPKSLFGRLLSTKENTRHHGIGLKNVHETAEKYGGNVEFETKDGVFITSVLLFFGEGCSHPADT